MRVIAPKVISIGTAFPPNSYTQEELWDALGYSTPHFKRIFMGGEIQRRHLWMDPLTIKDKGWQELQEGYLKGATKLSRRAVRDCLDFRRPSDIGCVVFVSCTGYQCPSIAHRLDMGFPPDTYYTNILGMGCEGGFPGLKRAYDYVVTSGKTALVIATELSSCTFFPEVDGRPDPENDYEILRSNAIFADASAVALVGYDDNPRHPYIIDSESYCNSDYLDDLGYVWRDGRLRVLLSRRVPDLAPEVVAKALEKLLYENDLTLDQIEWFIVHAAGTQVLDNIRDRLSIPEEKMTLSREVLRKYGNCSSSTIGLIGKELMRQDIEPGDRVLVVSIGPGMVGGATLLQFPGGE